MEAKLSKQQRQEHRVQWANWTYDRMNARWRGDNNLPVEPPLQVIADEYIEAHSGLSRSKLSLRRSVHGPESVVVHAENVVRRDIARQLRELQGRKFWDGISGGFGLLGASSGIFNGLVEHGVTWLAQNFVDAQIYSVNQGVNTYDSVDVTKGILGGVGGFLLGKVLRRGLEEYSVQKQAQEIIKLPTEAQRRRAIEVKVHLSQRPY